MKVFLSHSTRDREFVETLADALRVEAIEPWLCEADIDYGDDFVAEIEKGLQESDLGVLFWSLDAAASRWTGREWRAILDRETEEARTRLGLVLLRDAAIPELLRTKHRIDARQDPDEGLQEVVNWLTRLRDMRRLEERKAETVLIDFEPTDFIGRAPYLEQLHAALVENQGQALLWGPPGSGKSMIALKFARRAQGAFQAVVFQHCGQRSVEEEICLELGSKKGLGHCYWQWGLLAREQKQSATEREKLQEALEILTVLNMPMEMEAVQKEIDKVEDADL